MTSRRLKFGNIGYTSFDVLVAMAVVSMLSAAVAPSMIGISNRAKLERVNSDIQTIEQTVRLYYAKFGKYPSQQDGLAILGPSSNSDPQAHFFDRIPKDPWGNEYVYLIPGVIGNFDIISYGADGRPGGVRESADIIGSNNAN